jgi:hypothetical protein
VREQLPALGARVADAARAASAAVA